MRVLVRAFFKPALPYQRSKGNLFRGSQLHWAKTTHLQLFKLVPLRTSDAYLPFGRREGGKTQSTSWLKHSPESVRTHVLGC